MDSYSVKLEQFLSEGELKHLRLTHFPNLLTLNKRYSPGIDISARVPITPLYLDYVRTMWRLDGDTGRPGSDVANSGLGYAFGLILESCTQLRWAVARDESGTFITMARLGDNPKLVSVPPFDFVSKREDVENAEVFLHFFEQIPAHAIGFERPSGWLPAEH